MPFLTLDQATSEIAAWLQPLQDELTKAGLRFDLKTADFDYHGKVSGEHFILELSGGVLVVGQPVEEINDQTVDERFSARLVVTEIELKRGRIGIGHRQSYGARRNGMPQFKSVIECAQKRLGTAPVAQKEKKPRNLIPEMVVDTQPNGVLLHIGSVLVSESCARAISDLITNDELYRQSN